MTMLDRMRRHRSWLKWSLALVVLTFIAFYARDFNDTTGTGGATAAAGLRDVVASVDGKEITAGEFQQRYQGQVQQYRAAYGGISDQLIKQLGLDQQILQQLVDEQAAMAEAERQGIRVSDEELAQQIFSIPGLQENGQFIGEARYEQLLRSQRPPMTKAQFEDGLRKSMMLDRLRTALTDWMAVTDQELNKEFTLRNEKIKVQVVALTADKFRDQVQVSDAEISSWYDAHKAEYRKGEQRKVKYLLVDRDAMRARQTVSPADVQNYYNQNIQQYQTPEQIRASHILLKTEDKVDADVKKQAEDVLKQVKSGGDFAALAKKYSEDDGSKVKGGDLDYFGKGQMVAEFETAAFKLKPGEVSDLVKTQFGYHIIKVVDHRAAATKSLDEVRAQITDTLAWQRVDAQIATKTRELDEKLKTAADMDAAAKDLGTSVQESGFFAREDPVPGLGAAPQVAVEAFKLADNAVSDGVNSPRGPVYIMVTGKKDPYVPALDEVKPRVREDVVRNKARDLSRERGTAIAASLRGAKDFAAAAKAQGLEAKSSELVAREAALPDVGVSPEVDKVAFSLPVGGVSEPIATSDSTVIVKVLEKKAVTPEEFAQQKDTFREQVLNERRNKFFTAYMTKAKQNMKIEIRTDVARRAIGA